MSGFSSNGAHPRLCSPLPSNFDHFARPQFEGGLYLENIMHLLPINLEALESLTGESARFALGGVHLRLMGDNTYIAEATDGHSLLRVTGNCGDKEEYPELPALKASPNGELEAIIPARDWKEAFVAAKKVKHHKAALRTVACVIGKEVTSLASTNLERINFLQPKNIEGRFPATDQILRPESEAFATVALTPTVIIETLQTFSKLTGAQIPVYFDLFNAKTGGPVTLIGIRGQTPECRIDGAIVPCSQGKDDSGVKQGDANSLAEIDRLNETIRALQAGEEFPHIIAVAADSITDLRRCDIDRVISNCPHHDRVYALANWIVERRPDLIDAVHESMRGVAEPELPAHDANGSNTAESKEIIAQLKRENAALCDTRDELESEIAELMKDRLNLTSDLALAQSQRSITPAKTPIATNRMNRAQRLGRG